MNFTVLEYALFRGAIEGATRLRLFREDREFVMFRERRGASSISFLTGKSVREVKDFVARQVQWYSTSRSNLWRGESRSRFWLSSLNNLVPDPHRLSEQARKHYELHRQFAFRSPASRLSDLMRHFPEEFDLGLEFDVTASFDKIGLRAATFVYTLRPALCLPEVLLTAA